MTDDDDPSPDDSLCDDLIRLILARTEPIPPSGGHIDLDSLAVLAEGGLSAGEREEVWAHIATCPPCRRLVGATITDAAGAQETRRGLPKDGLATPT
jgi:anti-sigma factor RsiW